jgi:aerobic carbon-monoxide dehydrogenase large subunit
VPGSNCHGNFRLPGDAPGGTYDLQSRHVARDHVGYVGSSVPRREDGRLLIGQGRYTDSVRLPGMVHAVVVRSPVAHGRLVRCDPAAALAAAGVLDVLTPAGAVGIPMPSATLVDGRPYLPYPLLDTTVRYVGQPVAVVTAETLAQATDAAELLDLEYEPLPAVLGIEAALADGAPRLYPEWDRNLHSEYPVGDSAAQCEAVIARAAQVVELTATFARVAPHPMETRRVVARDTEDGLTVWISTQAPYAIRDALAETLGRSHDRIRVISREVGGGFGAKEHLYPDELLACVAAIRVRRPVAWVESPTDRLTATLPARAATHRARLALDAEGRFLALYAEITGDLGAECSHAGTTPLAVTAAALPGPYHFERAGGYIRAVLTNRTPTGSYRGFGQPEAAWTRERLIDEAARQRGEDPVELRLRNMIGPYEMPFPTRTGRHLDTGDYPLALRTLRELVQRDAAGTARPADGRRRGIGYACQTEGTGMGPSMVMRDLGGRTGGYETAVVRMEQDGSVAVSAGVIGMGQGIETALAQLAADRIGVPLDLVRIELGDTATTPYSGIGSVASRSAVVGGGAVVKAAEQLREHLLAIAAHQLEAAADDLEIAEGTVRVKGDPSASHTFAELATSAWRGWDLPAGMPPGLVERASYDPPAFCFPYGAHAAAVAVDPETGAVEVEGYWAVADSGVVINPSIVEGQLVGGIVQGIGMALTEEIAYTPEGHPLAEYHLPSAVEVPPIRVTLLSTPSPITPGGMKGAGESGTIGAPAAIGNAVAAAIPELAPHLTATPITPRSLWPHLPR